MVRPSGILSCVLCLAFGATVFAQPAAEQPTERPAIASAAELSAAFRNAARSTLPAVVSVTSRMAGRQVEGSELSPLEDELFRRFFGEEGMEQFDFRGRSQPPRRGQGSGFVIDSSGIILTNSHVVNGADSVTVAFQNGTELPAESWQTDPWSDVAIVRVKPAQPLTAIPIGDSDKLAIGDWVLALGNPFGIGTSVTAGIISGTGRAPHINAREDFLQTDAAINPGNSGGPLVNLSGEVVGINTAISTRSGGYDGVGFAVPINLADWVAQQLIAKGVVERPYLGVAVQPLTAELRQQFGIELGAGALVAQIFPDSPAQEAGLRPGDVILDVGGTPVANGVSLQGVVERLKIGEAYPVTVIRDGQRETVSVTLKKMPDQYASAPSAGARPSPDDGAPEPAAATSLGIEVSDLTTELRRSLGVDEDVTGVVVTNVDRAGPAAEKGISRGDIIQRVGTTPVNSIEEFNAAIAKASQGNGVLLLLRQGQGTRFVVVMPRE